MSQLKLEAEVTVDNSSAGPALKQAAADVTAAKVALLEADRAGKTAAQGLAAAEKAARATGLAGQELNRVLKDETRALIETKTAGEAAAAGLKRAQQAANDLTPAADRASRSIGQMRAGGAQLGQQLQDVGIGIQAGTSGFTILAQQGGQAAYALSQMGGAAGKLGTALSGPLGAALIIGTSLLGPFVLKLLESGDASDKAAGAHGRHGSAARTLEDALKDLDAATGRSNKSAAEAIRQSVAEVSALQNREVATRKLTKAKLEAALADLKGQQSGALLAGGGAESFATAQIPGLAAIGELQAQLKKQDEALAQIGVGLRGAVQRHVEDNVKAVLDPVFKATRDFEAAKTNLQASFAKTGDQAAYQSGLLSIEREKQARLDAIDAAKSAEKAGIRDAETARKASLRAATREAEAFGKALAKAVSEASRFRIDFPAGFADRPDEATAFQKKQGFLPEGTTNYTEMFERLKARSDEAAQKFHDTVVDAGRNVATSFQAAAGQVVRNVLKGEKAGSKIDLKAAGGNLLVAIGEDLAGKFLDEALKPILEPLEKIATILGKIVGALLKYSPLGLLLSALFKVKTGSATVANVAGVGTITGTSGNSQKQIAAATKLGDNVIDSLQSILDQLGGTLGDFAVSIGKHGDKFVVDNQGRGKTKGSGTTKYKNEQDAISAAIADALGDGAIAGVSPRVQAVLKEYAGSINKAVAEALKVKNLEELLADDADPFAADFRDAERQRRDRLIAARQYGFDIAEIERINAKEREAAIKSALDSTTSTVKALLDDLKYGTRSTGSASEKLVSLTAERDRLAALIQGGDTTQLDPLAKIAQQLIDTEREAFGATQSGARDSTTSLLNQLVTQTEDRIRASARAAEDVTRATNDKLTELNATADDTAGTNAQIAGYSAQQVALLTQLLGKIAGASGVVVGGSGTAGVAATYARQAL